MCFDYFPLIITHMHNISWPREHLLLYNIAFAIAPISSESLVSVRFKLLVIDQFIPFSDWSKRIDSFLARYNWHQSSMKSPSCAIFNQTNNFFESLEGLRSSLVPITESEEKTLCEYGSKRCLMNREVCKLTSNEYITIWG